MTTHRIAFIGYTLAALAIFVIGVRYTLASEVMPYHLTAMGSSWDGLTAGIRIMSINFMNSVGAGFLSCATALFILLFIPFRKKELWANWALAAVSLVHVVLIGARVITIQALTEARPPMMPFVVIGCVVIVSFLLALRFATTNRLLEKPE